jgi:hypothetical protein
MNQLRNKLLTEAERFIMGTPVLKGKEVRDVARTQDGQCSGRADFTLHPPCGSALCLAGFSCELDGMTTDQMVITDWAHIKERARRFLELSWDESENLFYLHKWDPVLQRAFKDAPSARQRALVGTVQISKMIGRAIVAADLTSGGLYQ